MRLILVRHATAEDFAERDFDRDLIEKGHLQAIRVGRFLAHADIRPDRILTSPLVRARETALHIASNVESAYGMIEDARLASGMRPETGCEILLECGKDETILMVGHEPDCSRLVSWLVGIERSAHLRFKKACSAFLTIDNPTRGGASLTAFIPAGLLKVYDECHTPV